MEPKYADPACIKFINGKFVLATNDPKNPVALVRQKTKGNETDVIVSLTTGESYDDTIDSLPSLVEVTSNKGWYITVVMDIGITIDSEYADANTVSKLKKLLDSVHDFTYTPNSEFYLPVSRMIPDRVILVEVTSSITFKRHQDDRVRGSGKVDMVFVAISPQACISSIADDIAEHMIGEFRRRTQVDTLAISVYDRNISNYDTEEIDIKDAIDSMDTKVITRSLHIEHDDKEYSTFDGDTTLDIAKAIVTSLP